MQYRDCYQMGANKLLAAGVPEAKWDAGLLLEHICHTSRNDLLAHGDREVTARQLEEYNAAIDLRAGRIPLQQITGEQEFMGLTFQVNEHVLIPRQDTEILVEQALKILKPGMRILDMCTGSGCILISLLAFAKGCSGVGVDISGKALAVAGKNGRRLLGGADSPDEEAADRVSWLQSDLFEKVTGAYDVMVSNPPYIPTAVLDGLMPEVRDHEPVMALDGKEDGLFFYRLIALQAEKYLKPKGYIFFEIGCEQAEDVSRILEQNAFEEIEVIKDYAGLHRVVRGRRKE